MTEKYPFIPSHLEKALEDVSIPLIDLVHGHLKVAMLEAEEALNNCRAVEDMSGEAIDSMERTYAEGYLDALTELYCLSYNLSIDRKNIEETR